jgi:protein SCO1/2
MHFLRQHGVFIVIALIALVSGLLIYQQLQNKPLPEKALYYQPPRQLVDFELTNHEGLSFTKAQLRGKWTLVFVGYTSCPDVCPTTLQQLAFAYPKLKAIAPNVQVLFVAVDPKRDTVSKLNQYIQYFNSEFIAVRAEHDRLFPFVRNLGLMYAIADDVTNPNYLVDHSASIVLINPQAQISAIFKAEQQIGQVPGVSMNQLLQDFERIVALNP